MTRFFQKWLALTLLAAFTLIPLKHARAECLPEKGTFQGVYHENRAGVGRFKFFIVPQELKKQLAPFDGKYIELEVLSGRQPMNPGPVIIDKIGTIKELTQAPIQVEINTVTPGSAGPETFDVVYAFKNVGRETVVFDATHSTIGLQKYQAVENPDEIDRFWGTGYTRKQLEYGGDTGHSRNFIDHVAPAVQTHSYTGQVQLQPGEAVPFVWHGVRAEPGQYELAVMLIYSYNKTYVPIEVWKPLDLPLPKDKNGPRDNLVIRAQVTRQEEWLTIEGRLINETGTPRHIFVLPTGDQVFLPGFLQLYDKNAKLLGAELEWDRPDGPWIRKEIDKKGLAFRFRIRQSDLFPATQEDRIGFWTVTENGIEKLTVAKDLPARAWQRESPWGAKEKGCRCRIRLAKDQFAPDEQIRFFFQAESDRKLEEILRINRGNFQSHVSIEIDGKPAAVSSTGLTDGIVYYFPFDREVQLVGDLKLATGKHNIQAKVKGDPGTYMNHYRQFDGTLISNVVEFEVKE